MRTTTWQKKQHIWWISKLWHKSRITLDFVRWCLCFNYLFFSFEWQKNNAARCGRANDQDYIEKSDKNQGNLHGINGMRDQSHNAMNKRYVEFVITMQCNAQHSTAHISLIHMHTYFAMGLFCTISLSYGVCTVHCAFAHTFLHTFIIIIVVTMIFVIICWLVAGWLAGWQRSAYATQPHPNQINAYVNSEIEFYSQRFTLRWPPFILWSIFYRKTMHFIQQESSLRAEMSATQWKKDSKSDQCNGIKWISKTGANVVTAYGCVSFVYVCVCWKP